MASLNKVMLIGYVGADPEVKTFEDGRKLVRISLATTERSYVGKNGETIPERTEWHKVAFFSKLGELVEKYVRKGMPLYVEGKIQTRKYEKDGQTLYTVDILGHGFEMLGSRQPEDGEGRQPANPNASAMKTALEDGLPF